jgi:hypothetical protein
VSRRKEDSANYTMRLDGVVVPHTLPEPRKNGGRAKLSAMRKLGVSVFILENTYVDICIAFTLLALR